MVIHITQVHKEQVRKIPNAIKGRDDLSLNIVGMDGIPQNMIDDKLRSLGYEVAVKDDENKSGGIKAAKPIPPPIHVTAGAIYKTGSLNPAIQHGRIFGMQQRPGFPAAQRYSEKFAS